MVARFRGRSVHDRGEQLEPGSRVSLTEATLTDWLSRRIGGKLCNINPEGELL